MSPFHDKCNKASSVWYSKSSQGGSGKPRLHRRCSFCCKLKLTGCLRWNIVRWLIWGCYFQPKCASLVFFSALLVFFSALLVLFSAMLVPLSAMLVLCSALLVLISGC